MKPCLLVGFFVAHNVGISTYIICTYITTHNYQYTRQLHRHLESCLGFCLLVKRSNIALKRTAYTTHIRLMIIFSDRLQLRLKIMELPTHI